MSIRLIRLAFLTLSIAFIAIGTLRLSEIYSAVAFAGLTIWGIYCGSHAARTAKCWSEHIAHNLNYWGTQWAKVGVVSVYISIVHSESIFVLIFISLFCYLLFSVWFLLGTQLYYFARKIQISSA